MACISDHALVVYVKTVSIITQS